MITPDHREKMIEEASRVASARVVKRIQHILNLVSRPFVLELFTCNFEVFCEISGGNYDSKSFSLTSLLVCDRHSRSLIEQRNCCPK